MWFGLCLQGGGFDSTGGDEGEDCASARGSPEVSSLLGPTLDLFDYGFMLLSVTPGRMVSYQRGRSVHCECSLNPDKSMPKPIPTSAVSGFVCLGRYRVSRIQENPHWRGRLIPSLPDESAELPPLKQWGPEIWELRAICYHFFLPLCFPCAHVIAWPGVFCTSLYRPGVTVLWLSFLGVGFLPVFWIEYSAAKI